MHEFEKNKRGRVEWCKEPQTGVHGEFFHNSFTFPERMRVLEKSKFSKNSILSSKFAIKGMYLIFTFFT